MTRIALLALALAACKTTSGTSSSTTPPSGGGPTSSGGSFERPTGPTQLKKGEPRQVEINQGEKHEWFIELAAGEKVTFTMAATSTGNPMCSNWIWGFYNPGGGALQEQAMGPEPSGAWKDQIATEAVASIVEGPTAGRYTVKVVTDPAWCAQLRYTLAAQ